MNSFQHDGSCAAVSSSLLLQRLAESIETQLGIYFPRKSWNSLAERVTKLAISMGFKSLSEFVDSLSTGSLSHQQEQQLASELSVGETYFFRDPDLFTTLEQDIFPTLIARRSQEKRLQIWSAGCASGEEAYSIALLLKRLIRDIDDWDINIIATDIDADALNKAKTGAYGPWSFRREMDKSLLGETEDGVLYVNESIKSLVSFQYHNLVDLTFPNPVFKSYDLVLCRNVLMYFEMTRALKVLEHLKNCMSKDAYLFLSTVELPNHIPANMKTIRFANGSIALMRNDGVNNDLKGRQTGQHHSKSQNPAHLIATVLPVNKASTAPPQEPSPSADDVEEITESSSNKLTIEHELIAKVKLYEEKYQLAAKHCEMAIANDRLNPTLYLLRAKISGECGLHQDSARFLRQCLFLNPDCIVAHFKLGKFHYFKRNYSEARLHWLNAFKLLNTRNRDDIVEHSNGILVSRYCDDVMNYIQLVSE